MKRTIAAGLLAVGILAVWQTSARAWVQGYGHRTWAWAPVQSESNRVESALGINNHLWGTWLHGELPKPPAFGGGLAAAGLAQGEAFAQPVLPSLAPFLPQTRTEAERSLSTMDHEYSKTYKARQLYPAGAYGPHPHGSYPYGPPMYNPYSNYYGR